MSGIFNRLTGLEQYYWERAGYFLRRRPSQEDIADCDTYSKFASQIAQDILGPETRELYRDDCKLLDWNRCSLPLDADNNELHRHEAGITVLVPLGPFSIVLIPGSHVAPLAEKTLQQLGDGLPVEECVRLDISPGDVLICCSCIAHCVEVNLGDEFWSYHYLGPAHPEFSL